MMRQASLNSVTRCPSLIAVKIGSGKMSIIVWVVWVLHGPWSRELSQRAQNFLRRQCGGYQLSDLTISKTNNNLNQLFKDVKIEDLYFRSDVFLHRYRYLDTGISINNKCNINLRLLISALASSVMNKVGPILSPPFLLKG